MQEQTIAKGDVLQKIAGLGFIVGGILTLVSNALFPRAIPTRRRPIGCVPGAGIVG